MRVCFFINSCQDWENRLLGLSKMMNIAHLHGLKMASTRLQILMLLMMIDDDMDENT